MGFGERLKKARQRKGLTQAQLGKLLNVSDATINRYEREQRKPDPEMLRKLAEVLDVSVDYLLNGPKASVHDFENLAAHRTDDPLNELPKEARRSLEEFQEYILRKYGKKKD
jgi:transcriptional regulator with XRE-family HTH domain